MKLTFKQYGNKGMLVQWPTQIEEKILHEMQAFIKTVYESRSDVNQIHHAYQEILIQFKNRIKDYNTCQHEIELLYSNLGVKLKSEVRLWEIPVCYDTELAPDLNLYLSDKGIDLETLIQRHTAPNYMIHFIGFLPGFLYLGGLDERLAINRKDIPSKKIKRGTVAIGGAQTGIYPQDSPGGWYGIGYTPVSFFDTESESPVWAKAGDRIRFKSINRDELISIEAKTFIPQSEIYVG